MYMHNKSKICSQPLQTKYPSGLIALWKCERNLEYVCYYYKVLYNVHIIVY